MMKFILLPALLSCFATFAMENPPMTPAQKAAAQFKTRIDQEFKPELMTALKEFRPFNVLAQLKDYYNQQQSLFPSLREMYTSFMLALEFPSAALGSKIADLRPTPTDVERAWQKEWVLMDLKNGLDTSQNKLNELNRKLATAKNSFAGIVDQQAFTAPERDLEAKQRLLIKAKKMVARHNALARLQEYPLLLLRDKQFQDDYNKTLRESYSPQTLNLDAQDMHPLGHSLLFQLCDEELSLENFEQMLTFLTSGEQALPINQVINEETVLDYATKKLDNTYIETIKKRGGTNAPSKTFVKSVLKRSGSSSGKTLRWSDGM